MRLLGVALLFTRPLLAHEPLWWPNMSRGANPFGGRTCQEGPGTLPRGLSDLEWQPQSFEQQKWGGLNSCRWAMEVRCLDFFPV